MAQMPRVVQLQPYLPYVSGKPAQRKEVALSQKMEPCMALCIELSPPAFAVHEDITAGRYIALQQPSNPSTLPATSDSPRSPSALLSLKSHGRLAIHPHLNPP